MFWKSDNGRRAVLATALSEFRPFRGEVAKGPAGWCTSLAYCIWPIALGTAGINSQAIGGFWQVVKTQSRILVPSDLALVPGVKNNRRTGIESRALVI